MLRTLATPLLVASAVRASAGLVSGWRVLNECAIDTDDRILKDFTTTRGDDTTPASCIASCSAQGYTHAGVEDGMECICGNGVEDDIESVKVSECDVPCSGDSSQKCGGDWRITLYTSGSSDRPPTPLPSGWGMLADCAVDVADRLFNDTQITKLESNTPLACATHCSDQGFAYASVENGRECHCGNTFARLVTPRPVSDCYMQCPGDAEQECGGPWAAQIYSDLSLVPSPPAPQPSGFAPAFLTPIDPADLALGLPAGWRTAYACAQTGDPPLLEDVNMLRDNSPARCAQLCEAKGFRAAGVEYSGVCACGDEYEALPALRPKAECGIPCPQDPSLTCGGEWRIQLYTRDPKLVPAVTALPENSWVNATSSSTEAVAATIVSEDASSISTADSTTWMVGDATSTSSTLPQETSTSSSDIPAETVDSTDAAAAAPSSSGDADASATSAVVEDGSSTLADAVPTESTVSFDTLSPTATAEGELSTSDYADTSSTSIGADEPTSSAEDVALPTGDVENIAATTAQPDEPVESSLAPAETTPSDVSTQ